MALKAHDQLLLPGDTDLVVVWLAVCFTAELVNEGAL